MLNRKVKLASNSQEDFETQMDWFLAKYGFEVNDVNKAIYGSLVQTLDKGNDSFDPIALSKELSRHRANMFAYYAIHPEKKPKNEQPKEVTEAVVQEAKS